MSVTFYCGSGSPYAWKVWLVLEHKQIPYELKVLSFDRGDTRSPEFRAINPRGQVPAIAHDGFTLWESGAIAEYLEERFPERPLMPKDAKGRAVVRRLMHEADNHLYKAQNGLFKETMYTKEAEQDSGRIQAAQTACLEELARWDALLTGDYLAGGLSLADFTAFPFARLVRRLDDRQPKHGIGARIPARLAAWMRRIEALPYYARTIPPHWKA